MTMEAEKLLSGLDNVVFEKCDVGDWAQLENLVTVAKEKFGKTPDVCMSQACEGIQRASH